MRISNGLVACAWALSNVVPASGQSCVPSEFPGPPLVIHDLNDLRVAASLGPDGVVREAGPSVLMPVWGTNHIELEGTVVELTDRADNGVVWCANSIVAYPTRSGSIRLLRAGTEAVRDFKVPLDRAFFSQMSDGSVWYHAKGTRPQEAGVEWHRLDVDTGVELVHIPAGLVVIDAYEDMVLVGERERNASGGRVAWVVTR